MRDEEYIKRVRRAVEEARSTTPDADEKELLGAAMRLLRGQANPAEVLAEIRTRKETP